MTTILNLENQSLWQKLNSFSTFYGNHFKIQFTKQKCIGFFSRNLSRVSRFGARYQQIQHSFSILIWWATHFTYPTIQLHYEFLQILNRLQTYRFAPPFFINNFDLFYRQNFDRPWGHLSYNKKFRSYRFSRFKVYWMKTDK